MKYIRREDGTVEKVDDETRAGGDFGTDENKDSQAEKEKEIRKTANKLRKIFKDADANKQAIIRPLIDTMAFTAVSMKELEAAINKDGYSSFYQNGENQMGTKQNDDVKTYIAFQKNLTAAVKALADMAPEKQEKNKLSEFFAKYAE